MKCWKSNFNDKTLKDRIKFKDSITDIRNDGYVFKACVKGKYQVELTIQDDILYDMSCSCSKKSAWAHESGLLYFLDDFPEILEDFKNKTSDLNKISKTDVNKELKIISPNKLVKFLKKEFKKNPKIKYDYIKHFSDESLIDEKSYERKLKGILRRGKGRGFSNHGYYDLEKIGSELKKFLKKDIQVLFDVGEYAFAYKMLSEIMEIFIDQFYWMEDVWYDIAYYYRQYCYDLFELDVLSESEKLIVQGHLYHINNILF